MAVAKSFDFVVPFAQLAPGRSLPLVSATFFPSVGRPFVLALIFDTGATQITLRTEYAQFFGKTQSAGVNVPGSAQAATGALTTGTVEVFGRTLRDRQILFLDLATPDPAIAGLLGRDCFDSFGFGFWESTRELYVSMSP